MFIHQDFQQFFPHPDGKFPTKYPSVTRILSATEDRSGLDAWIARVGEAEAARISKESTEFGNSLHDRIERYFLHPDIPLEELPPGRLSFTYDALQSKLSQKDIVPVGIEIPLQSHILQVQGRADFIGYINGELHIVDWKTSKKMKERKWIGNYFKQATAYALCFKEMTGIPVKHLSIVICGELFCQWESDLTKNWVSKLKESFDEYKAITDISLGSNGSVYSD